MHSPVVTTNVPSKSIVARSKNFLGCRAQTFKPCLVGGLHQTADARLVKAPAEVTRGGWVGNPLRAQGVKEDLVVASQLDVLESRAVAQRVVSQVQHVIGLMVRTMDLQQMQVTVDGIDEADLAGQLMDQSNASNADGTHLVGEFHADVRCCEHGPTLIFSASRQPLLDSLLGFPQTFLYTGLHSKSSVSSGSWVLLTTIRPRKTRMVSSFS